MEELRELPLRALLDDPDGFDAIRLYERGGFLDDGDRVPLREGSDVVTMSMTRSLG